MENFADLTSLPGTTQEKDWLEERLRTLGIRESYALAAAAMRHQPKSMEDVIHCLQLLEDHEVCFPAGSCVQLGEYWLRQDTRISERALYFADLDSLGRQYENKHPGVFLGSCYVAYPEEPEQAYNSRDAPLPEDTGWSVKLKLSSPALPEGVWLRLPDHTGLEAKLARTELHVPDLAECTLLDAVCILPEAGNLMAQYDNPAELIRDGNALGAVLDERGQGAEHWMERFAAALELEACHDLRLALDISQNLPCYEWISCSELEKIGRRQLLGMGVPEELLDAGCIDLAGYAGDMLENKGYMLTGDEQGYIARNSREFVREFSQPHCPELTMR